MDLASKRYYEIINESNIIESSGIKKWKTIYPIYFEQWKINIYLYMIQQEIII